MLTAQLTIADAIAEGQRGMAQAGGRAGAPFSVDAFFFLDRFAKTSSRPFSSEEVTELAATKGLVAPDARAWGGVFQRAARAGAIRRSTVTYRRRFGHGSVGVMWERA